MGILRHTTPEQKIYLLTAAAGAAVTIADFLGLLDLSGSTLAKMTILLVALLLVASATQAGEILRALRDRDPPASAFEFVEMHSKLPRRFEDSVQQANIINEAVLTWYVEASQEGRDRYRIMRDKRVFNGDAVLNQLVIIRHQQHFREVLATAIRFRDSPRYSLRYFELQEGPALPLINLWSFDTEVYLGSIDIREPTLNAQMLHLTDAHLAAWICQYWSAAWSEARSQWLKQGSSINFPAFKEIARGIHMSDTAYAELVARLEAVAPDGEWLNGELVKKSKAARRG